MIQLACHAWGFNKMPLTEALGTIARLGFRHVDLGTGPHIDVDNATQQPQAAADRIRRLLDEFDLSLTDLYIMLPHINSPDPNRRQQELELFQRLVPFAIALGTPGITVSPGILCPDGPDHSLARAVPALLRIVNATDDLRISFEPHLDSAASSPAQAVMLMDAVPGLSLTLDLAHMIAQSVRWSAIRDLFKNTAHIQVRQAATNKLQTPFERGKLDLNQLVNELTEAAYHGVLTIEYMTTFGWHGMMEVNIAREITKTRNALRDARANVKGQDN